MAPMTAAELATLCASEKDGVTTVSRLREAGVTPHVIRSRCRADGPWRLLLPGVIQLGKDEPGRRQRQRAAFYYAGPGSVVTGGDALRAQGVAFTPSRAVHVLVPVHRRINSSEFVHLERTSRMPEPLVHRGIPYAPAARAVIDLARTETAPDRLRRLLTLPVYYGLCTVEGLRAELEAGSQRGTAPVRAVLRGLGSLGDIFLHGAARRALETVPLSPPEWNVTICDSRGSPLGVVDAWWDEVALGWQFGAGGSGLREPSLNHLALTAAGVTLVRTEPDQLRSSTSGIARELTSAFAHAARRRRPPVRAMGSVPAAV